MNIVNNGSTKINSLKDAEIVVNGNCDIIAGGETKIQAKEKCSIEAMSCEILSNNISFDIATSTASDIVTIDGIPDTDAIEKSSNFEMSVGSDLGTPILSVQPSALGGPFNALMFDPLTGALHQGRHVSGPTAIKTVDPTRQAELIRQTAILKTQQAKEISDSTIEITKKYNSITEQTKLAVSGPAAVAFTQKKMAQEISDSTQAINEKYDALIEDLDKLYGSNIKKPVFGTNLDPSTPQGKSFIHTSKIPEAEVRALLDPTNKTTYFDLIGPSGGFNNVEEE
jgi:hypothetical protein